jgi:hypothetical protein
MSSTDQTSKENQPIFMDKGKGVWNVVYFWRDIAEALVQFRKTYPHLTITAMHCASPGTGRAKGEITLVTEPKKSYRDDAYRGPG